MGASSSKKTSPTLGPCLRSSYPPCSYLDRSLQSQPDLTLEEAGTLPTHPLMPKKQSILVTEHIKGWRSEGQSNQRANTKLQSGQGQWCLQPWVRHLVQTLTSVDLCSHQYLTCASESSPELRKCHGGLYAPRYS